MLAAIVGHTISYKLPLQIALMHCPQLPLQLGLQLHLLSIPGRRRARSLRVGFRNNHAGEKSRSMRCDHVRLRLSHLSRCSHQVSRINEISSNTETPLTLANPVKTQPINSTHSTILNPCWSPVGHTESLSGCSVGEIDRLGGSRTRIDVPASASLIVTPVSRSRVVPLVS